MKVSFVQSGGYAGLIRGCELNTGLLDPQAARELERLVASSGISASGEFLSESGRDLRQYELTIEKADRKISVTFDDETAPRSVRPLLSYLNKRSRPKALE